MSLWSLREHPQGRSNTAFAAAGVVVLLAVWWFVTTGLGTPKSVLPSPWDAFVAIPELALPGTIGHVYVPTAAVQDWFPGTNSVIWHLIYSVFLNLSSYIIAIGIAIPLGFAMGLFGPIRAMFLPQFAIFRYAPIPAFAGIFIRWFGLSYTVKITFLAFGVLVYLIPAVVQLVDDVDEVYPDMAKTLGATKWQCIRTIFWPLATAKLSDVARNLVPITWTYIVIAEGFNLSEGGLGALVSNYTRSGRWDLVFGSIFLMLFVGWCQDHLWTRADRLLFNWKHA